MAAGIIQGTVTTTSGETIEMSWLVDNTSSPTKWYNTSHLVDATGAAVQFSSLGINTRANSQPVVLADIQSGEYETVIASQTAQALGATGAAGDYVSGVLVVPATTSPGNIIIKDGSTSITIFTGGASSVSNLVPFFIPLGLYSLNGAWALTTGANVSAIGVGNFT